MDNNYQGLDTTLKVLGDLGLMNNGKTVYLWQEDNLNINIGVNTSGSYSYIEGGRRNVEGVETMRS